MNLAARCFFALGFALWLGSYYKLLRLHGFAEDTQIHGDESSASLPKGTPESRRSNKKYEPVSCSRAIAQRDDPSDTTIGDPNKGLNGDDRQKHSRHTTTEPPFWISLHKKFFDGSRWASIMVKGEYYETGITKQVKEALANRRPGLVIDVGLNIGWFSLYARALGHTAAGFEPNPIQHVRVCESIALNICSGIFTCAETYWSHSDEDSSIQIFPFGLGEVDAGMNLTTGHNPGASSFDETRLAKKFRKTIPVRVVTLDGVAEQEGWLDKDGPIIHLLKADVEGYEYHVFLGAKKLINSGRVNNILMESSFRDEQVVASVFTMLVEAGYRLKTLSSVNGDPYHPEKVPVINNAITNNADGSATPTIDLSGIKSEIEFIAKVTSNLWWTLQKSSE